MKILCNRCNKEVEPITKDQVFPGGVHLRADCPECGRWIKWLKKEVETILFQRPTLESIKEKYV